MVKWLKGTLFTVFGVFLLVFLLIQIPGVQNYIGQKIVQRISSDLDTEIMVDKIHFNLFGLELENIYVEDQDKDTLLSLGSVKANFSAFQLLRNKIDFSYIRLEEGLIDLNRYDGKEAFNYQFIADYFDTGKKDTGSSGSDWAIDPGLLDLSQIELRFTDVPQLSRFGFRIGRIRIDPNSIHPEEQLLDLYALDLIKTDVRIHVLNEDSRLISQNYSTAGDEVTEEKVILDPVLNATGWKINVDRILLDSCSFQLKNFNRSQELQAGLINFDNLFVKHIDGQFSDTRLIEDTIFTKMDRFAFQEQNGFVLDTLTADIKFSTNELSLDNFILATPNTLVNDRLAFNYKQLSDWDDFENKVSFAGNFRESGINIKDIEYFAGKLGLPYEPYKLNGRVYGKVNSLFGRDLELEVGSQTSFKGKMSIYNVTNPNQAYFDIQVNDLISNSAQFDRLLPFANIPDEVHRLGNIMFHGSFTGFSKDFVAFGDLNSSLGFIHSDIQFELDKDGNTPLYKGNLGLVDFKIGKWLNKENILGSITLNSEIKGRDFNWENLSIEAIGNIDQLEFKDYNYSNIKFNGNLERRLFEGWLDVKDDNLDFTFQGTMDFQQEVPSFDINTQVYCSRLKKLNLTDDDLNFVTEISAKFEGIDVDNTIGSINLKDAHFYRGNDLYNIGEVALISEKYELGKRVSLNSTIAEGNLDGNFSLENLPNTLMHLFTTYYPSAIKLVEDNGVHQDFMFSFEIKESNKLTDLLLPEINGLKGTMINGNINSSAKRIMAFVNLPKIDFQGFDGEDIDLYFSSNDDTLNFEIEAGSISLPNNMEAGHELNGYVSNNQINFNLKVYDKEASDNLFANAIMTNIGDTILFSIINSNLELAGQQWEIKSDNALKIYKKQIFTENLELSSLGQNIVITSSIEEEKGNIIADLTDISLKDLLNIVDFKDYEMLGTVNGSLQLNNFLEEDMGLTGDIRIDDLMVGNDSMGNLSATHNYNFEDDVFKTDISLQSPHGKFRLNGLYDSKNQGNELNFELTADNTPFKVLEPFLVGVISELEGNLTGNFTLRGGLEDPEMKGNLQLLNSVVKVDYLNSKYYLEPASIGFNGNSIYINETKITDGIGENASSAVLGGEILINKILDIELKDLYVHTENNFRFMETTEDQNESFYGSAYGKGIILINGPVNDLDIYVNASTDPNTFIYIPISYENSASSYDFINFLDHNEDTLQFVDYRKLNSGLDITLDISITKDAEVQMIFNKQTGEIIRGKGDGNIKIKVSKSGEIEMFGDYIIDEGDYLFKLENIVSKKFTIEKGGTITWTGDPNNALLNINAIYRRKAQMFDLVSDLSNQMSEEQKEGLRQSVDVLVYLNMLGVLSSPDLKFDIEVPSSTESVTSVFSNRLRVIKEDENELNKQVFGILVFGRFLPQDLSGNNALASTTQTTITEFISNQLSIYFNDWLSKYDMEVYFQYRTYDQNSGDPSSDISNNFRNELELEFNKKIGRVTIYVGGNIDLGGSTPSNSTRTQYGSGDFAIEYNLTKDGRFRIKAFNESDYNILYEDYLNKQGVGIYWTKEFDTFRELFQKKKKPKEDNPEKDKQLDENESSPESNKGKSSQKTGDPGSHDN